MNTLLLVWIILNTSEPIRFSAGSMEIIRQGNKTFSHLYNGVEITYGTVNIVAKEGYYNDEDSTGFLVGDIQVSLESGEVSSDTLWFNATTGELRFSNSVEWVDTMKRIHSDYAEYLRDTIRTKGNIMINLLNNKTTVFGERGIFFGGNQRGRIWGNTRLVVYDHDTVEISADTFLVSEDTIVGLGKILLTSKIGTGTAKTVKIFEDNLLLIDSSEASWARGRVKADTIVILRQNDTLTILRAKSNGILISEEDSSSLNVKAYEISMNFVRDSLESIIGYRVKEGIYDEQAKRESDTKGD